MITEDEKEAVDQIIMDQLNIEKSQLTEGARFTDDLGSDSLDDVEIAMAVEDALGCVLPEEASANIETLGDFYKLCGDCRKKPL